MGETECQGRAFPPESLRLRGRCKLPSRIWGGGAGHPKAQWSGADFVLLTHTRMMMERLGEAVAGLGWRGGGQKPVQFIPHPQGISSVAPSRPRHPPWSVGRPQLQFQFPGNNPWRKAPPPPPNHTLRQASFPPARLGVPPPHPPVSQQPAGHRSSPGALPCGLPPYLAVRVPPGGA